MNIHVFIAHMGLGGSERVCVNLANEWADKHEVHIVVLNLENDVNTQHLDKRIHVHELGVGRLRYSAIPILQYIKKYNPKFLFVFGMEMAIILNKLKKIGLIDTHIIVRVLNNVNISLAKEDNVSPVVENYLKKSRKQMKDMDVVIAQCRDMGKMLTDAKLVKEDRLRVIYNPVSKQLIDSVEQLRLTNVSSDNRQACRITYIGRIDPQKQPEHLIRMFKIVKEKEPKATLRIVGDGNLTERIKEMVLSYGLEENVKLDGIRKDMDRVYEESDVVVLTSSYEGMPNALIEAIGCGIPVVSYDCPIGPGEIIEDGVNGFLVKQDDIEAMADKTLLAVRQSWDSEIIKATCRKFDAGVIARKYEEIFREINV